MQKPPLIAHSNVASGTRCLHFGHSLKLHPCLVYESSKGYGDYVQLRRSTRAFLAQKCDKNQTRMHWLIDFIDAPGFINRFSI